MSSSEALHQFATQGHTALFPEEDKLELPQRVVELGARHGGESAHAPRRRPGKKRGASEGSRTILAPSRWRTAAWLESFVRARGTARRPRRPGPLGGRRRRREQPARCGSGARPQTERAPSTALGPLPSLPSAPTLQVPPKLGRRVQRGTLVRLTAWPVQPPRLWRCRQAARTSARACRATPHCTRAPPWKVLVSAAEPSARAQRARREACTGLPTPPGAHLRPAPGGAAGVERNTPARSVEMPFLGPVSQRHGPQRRR